MESGEIRDQLNGFGSRLNCAERDIARHDERIKGVETWLPGLQTALDALKETVHKTQIRLTVVYTTVLIVVQLVFKYFPGDK